jgi:hypothetical protein
MHFSRSIVLVPVLALAATLTVTAQAMAQDGEAVPVVRGYVSAHGGAVTGPPGPEFAVEWGERISRNTQAYVTVSYFENLMNPDLQDELDTLETSLALVTGNPWAFSARDRGVSLIGGGKYLFGGGNVRPYVGGGGGVISLRRTVTDVQFGDVRNAIFNDFGVGEADLSLAPASITKPLIEAAFGVAIVNGHAHFDIGYKYRRAYRLDTTLNFSQIGAGVGYRW